MLFLISCKQKSENYTHVILYKDSIYTANIQYINTPEKALISGYLFAYGNECIANSNKNKCEILYELNITDECNNDHVSFLKKWFKNDDLMQYKLRNCPNLPHNFATQNSIKKIVLKRSSDTLTITIKASGMNTIQEKFWTIEKTDSYLIKDNSFIKIN